MSMLPCSHGMCCLLPLLLVLQAPSNLPSAVGVLVEEGPGSFLVKVNCRDRHGLLSDITHALGNLPLQVSATLNCKRQPCCI